jgi:hypothetical protein
MKTIYIDSDYKCHIANDGTMTAVETDFFDGKCDAFIEGYRYVPTGEIWTRSDGEVFNGEMISPWKNYSELDSAQREYERQMLEQYKTELAELDAAMLEMQYQNLVEGL